MTTPEPGEPRARLDRPPGDRYRRPEPDAPSGPAVWPVVAVALAGVIGYVLFGGAMAVTGGLIGLAGLVGWLTGKLVSPPPRAAVVALVVVVAGLLGVWLFGRLEGGVLDPIAYLDEVQGWPLVLLQLVAGGGMAAAASR